MKNPVYVAGAMAMTMLHLSVSAQAVELVKWDFESLASTFIVTATSPGSIGASIGSGTATGSNLGSIWTSPVGNGSARALSGSFWAVGDYFQFEASTTGYRDVSVSFDQTSSGTGPREFKLQYSIDGTSFTDVGNYKVLQNTTTGGRTSWNSNSTFLQSAYSISFPLSGTTAVNDRASVFFRLTMWDTPAANGGPVNTVGTSRIDNFTVTATAVPEPATYATLAGVSLVGLAAWRRRSRGAA